MSIIIINNKNKKNENSPLLKPKINIAQQQQQQQRVYEVINKKQWRKNFEKEKKIKDEEEKKCNARLCATLLCKTQIKSNQKIVRPLLKNKISTQIELKQNWNLAFLDIFSLSLLIKAGWCLESVLVLYNAPKETTSLSLFFLNKQIYFDI